MKTNNRMIALLAAGIAVAGLAGFLLYTEKGKKWKNRLTKAGPVQDFLGKTKQKFSGFARDLMCEEKQEAMVHETKVPL